MSSQDLLPERLTKGEIMPRRRLFLICLLGLLVASFATMALGQGGEVPTAEVAVDWVERIKALITVWIPRLVIVASMLTAMFPSTNKFMSLIDGLAFAWGRARVDPKAQTRKA